MTEAGHSESWSTDMQKVEPRGTALIDQFIPRSSAALTNAAIDALFIVGFAALTGLSAKIAIYLNPAVPITGQTFAVLLSGAVLGSKRGAASMLVYLGTGIAGVPVFAPNGAIPNASIGYLIRLSCRGLHSRVGRRKGLGQEPPEARRGHAAR